MKKIIIGGLVGGLLMFIWQFLSWGPLGVHNSNLAYAPQQDAILEVLQKSGIEEGSYWLPSFPPEVPVDQHEDLLRKNVGKPWALLSYHNSFEMPGASHMIRGYVLDFVIMALLAWLLLQFKDLTFGKAVMASLVVGLIGYMAISYLNSVWFGSNSIPDLIDAVVQFGLGGLWLGFWLNR